MRRIAAVLLAGTTVALQADGPTLEVRDVVAEQAPQVSVIVRVLDSSGQPRAGLTAADFSVFEDGVEVTDLEVRQSHPSEEPVAVSLLVDTSGSMSTADLDGAKAGATAVLDRLTPEDLSELVSFDSDVEVIAPFGSPLDRAALDQLAPGGDTKLYDAVNEALDRIAAVDASVRALIVLSDGVDDGSATGADALLAEASAAGIPVHTIGLGDVDSRALEALSDASGGTFRPAPDAAALAEIYAETASSLLTEYRLGYRSAASDGEHELTIVARLAGEEASSTATLRFGPGAEPVDEVSSMPVLAITAVVVLAALGSLVLLLRAGRGGRNPDAAPQVPWPEREPMTPSAIAQAATGLHLVGDDGLFPLTGSTVLGRDPRADIVVGDETVSRTHARLQEVTDGLLVEDLGSANGTCVNGRRIQQHVAGPGDVLTFGDISFELRGPR